MPANAMVAPPGVDGRIFYDESVRGFNFHRERVPLAVALKTLLKYQHDDSPPTIYIGRSEEHTSELQSLMRISYAVFCLKKKKHKIIYPHTNLSLPPYKYNHNTLK